MAFKNINLQALSKIDKILNEFPPKIALAMAGYAAEMQVDRLAAEEKKGEAPESRAPSEAP
jgi:hypothetical protein